MIESLLDIRKALLYNGHMESILYIKRRLHMPRGTEEAFEKQAGRTEKAKKYQTGRTGGGLAGVQADHRFSGKRQV